MSKIIPVEPFDLILFGATGDLAKREIIPALYSGFKIGQVPPEFRLAGVSRSQLSDDEFRSIARTAILGADPGAETNSELTNRFLSRLSFVSADASNGVGWERLAAWPRPQTICTFFLSVSPVIFENIVQLIGHHKLAQSATRIVVEKPFGQNLESAQKLNRILTAVRRIADLPNRSLPW